MLDMDGTNVPFTTITTYVCDVPIGPPIQLSNFILSLCSNM